MQMKNAPTLVILAAGMGSRYGGLKQVDRLGPHGETLMEYAVFDALRAGFGKVVFVVRNSFEKEFLAYYESRLLAKINHDIVFQELDNLPVGFVCPNGREKPWGTAHAVWVCRDAVNEAFAVINADDFYGREAYENLYAFISQSTEGEYLCHAMNAYRLDNTLSDFGTVNRGICKLDAENYLERIEEHTMIRKDEAGNITGHSTTGIIRLEAGAAVSMNCWAFLPDVFGPLDDFMKNFLLNNNDNASGEAFLPAFVDQMIRTHSAKVKVMQSADEWFGLTYPQDKAMVMGKLKTLTGRCEYPAPLHFGKQTTFNS